MKIAVVGGGGFRTPLVVEAVTDIASEANVDEVVLYDVDAGRLERIAAVIEALDRESGRGVPVRTTTSLVDAVDGATAVFAAIRVGGVAARVVDERVPLELGVLGQETVGPGGISFALRTVPEMVRIARVVLAGAPDAWFVNFTNPAGLVTEAVRTVLGERAVGICDSPTALWRNVATALGRPASSLRPSYVGLNHLGWLTGMWNGDDLLPSLLRDDRLDTVHEVRLAGADHVRERRLIPNEYLVYYRSTEAVIAAFERRGARAAVVAEQQARFDDADVSTPDECLAAWRVARDARHGSYMAEARPADAGLDATGAEARSTGAEATGTDVAAATGYGFIAAAFVRAVTGDTGERLILGVRNGGAVSWLDDDATVEVPCVVGADGPRPDPVGDLAEAERMLMRHVREAERATLEAASSSSLQLVVDAVTRHPVVSSRDVARRIVDGYREHHAWMRERFA